MFIFSLQLTLELVCRLLPVHRRNCGPISSRPGGHFPAMAEDALGTRCDPPWQWHERLSPDWIRSRVHQVRQSLIAFLLPASPNICVTIETLFASAQSRSLSLCDHKGTINIFSKSFSLSFCHHRGTVNIFYKSFSLSLTPTTSGRSAGKTISCHNSQNANVMSSDFVSSQYVEPIITTTHSYHLTLLK